MAMFRSIATFAMKNVVEGTVIAMGGEFAAGICEQVGGTVGGHFRDHSKLVLQALQKAAEQAIDTVEDALAGSGLIGAFDAGDTKGLRNELENLLDGYQIDGKPLDRAWRKACLKEWKAARRDGLFDLATDGETLEAALSPFERFRNQADLVEAEDAALRDLESAARAKGFDLVARLLSIRPAGGPNLFALAVQHHFQCAIPKDQGLFATLTHAQLKGLSSGQRETLTQIADLNEKFDARFSALRGLVEDALRGLHLHDRALKLGDGLSIRTDAERRLVKQFRDLLRSHPPETLDAIDADRIARLLLCGGEYDAAAPLFQAAAEFAPDAQQKAKSLQAAYVNAIERRQLDEATEFFRQALAIDPTLAPFDPVKRPVERVLGAGGFGVVVLCSKQYLKSHRTVFKILRTEGLDRDPETFMEEARLLESIDHPNVIRVLNADIDTRSNSPVPYLELEYFDGVDLDTHVRRHGVLAPADVIAIAIQIARGLAVAHEKKIWHRDVKPSNVLAKKTAAGFEVKLIDFGLAARQQELANSLSLSRANVGSSVIADSLVGTLGYAAPEQLGTLKGVSVGPYSDVYGLGRTLCFLLCKKTDLLPKDWRAIPAELAAVIEQCVGEDPKERFDGGTAHRALAVLERLETPSAPERIPPVEAAALIANLRAPAVAKTPEPSKSKYDTLGSGSFDGLRPLGKNPNSGLYEFWHPASGAEPRRRQDGHFRIENDTSIVMVLLPGGTFWMGAQKNDKNLPNYDPHADWIESPVHQVTLDPFLLAKYPLTDGQWHTLKGSIEYDLPDGRDRPLAYPCEWVSWDQCTAALEKVGLNLPTEAQWEYGCRAGTSTPWWCADEVALRTIAAIDAPSGAHTAIVDSLGDNPFGLFHVHGNVWEWCQDWLKTYERNPPRAGDGLRDGRDGLRDGSYSCRVIRGGCFEGTAREARSACRGEYEPDLNSYAIGCRPAAVALGQ